MMKDKKLSFKLKNIIILKIFPTKLKNIIYFAKKLS